MQLHPTSRSRRVRRLLAVSAAAVAVMIAPTACNYGGPAQMDMPSHSGHMDGMNMDDPAQPGTPEEHQVVPVANQVPATAAPADDATTTSSARSRDDRRRGDSDRYRRGDQPTTSTTVPAATGGTTGATSTTTTAATDTTAAAGTVAATSSAAAPPAINNGLDVLGRTCEDLNAKRDAAKENPLPDHTGFQSGDAQCVSTQMGAVPPESNLPSLLITGAPRVVRVGEAFKLQVSTRNLVRDRFLGAAAGGYYLESSFLQDGTNLQRGHFHTACRNLASTRTAPEANKTPDFFLATQDGGGGATPDTVTIDVPGIKTAGVLQCTSWAGDGSHRTPMMSRANETPAIDSVRIFVIGRGQRVADDATASAAVAPAAATGNAAADAAADQAKQAQAEQAQAGAQKPDQDGAVQPLPADRAPADAAPTTAASIPPPSAAPAAN